MNIIEQAQLRKLLADLYPDKEDARRVARDAGLDLALIAFSSQAISTWDSVLENAEKTDHLTALIRVAQGDYPENSALQIYEQEDKVVYTEKKTRELTDRIEEKIRSLTDSGQIFLGEALRSYFEKLSNQIQQASELENLASPYKSLAAFDIHDLSFFYGREEAIQEIYQSIENGSLTILVSESGVGKTSVLKAGIRPLLVQKEHVPLYIRPYRTPVTAAIKQHLFPNYEQYSAIKDASLHDLLKQLTAFLANKWVVVLIDQFEEVLTIQSDAQRTEFVNELDECLYDDLLPVRWVFAVRRENVADIGLFDPPIKNPLANTYFLKRLTYEEAQHAVVLPAQRFGVTFEEPVVQMILDDIGQPGVHPANLQIICSTLFEKAKSRGRITEDLYLIEGRAGGILQKYLEETLTKFSTDQKKCARRIFDLLISAERKRTIKSRDELVRGTKNLKMTEREVDDLLTRLVNLHLIQISERLEGESDALTGFELVHDSLIETIDTDPFTHTQKVAVELFQQKATSYSILKDSSLLLTREEYYFIQPYLNNSQTEKQKRFLQESLKSMKRQGQKELIKSIGMIVSTVISVIVLSFIFQIRIQNNIYVSMPVFFFLLILVFAIIGAMRGWAREIIVAFSGVLALFIIVAIQFISPIKALLTGTSTSAFWVKTTILLVLAFFGYLTPYITGHTAIFSFSQVRIQDIMLGMIIGAINGYLIFGSIWYFLVQAQYPYNVFLAPTPGTPEAVAIQQFVNFLPPVWLTPPAIYFAVIVAFVFLLVVFI